MKRTQTGAWGYALLCLAASSLFLLAQCSSGTSNPVDGPGMLYFYAEW